MKTKLFHLMMTVMASAAVLSCKKDNQGTSDFSDMDIEVTVSDTYTEGAHLTCSPSDNTLTYIFGTIEQELFRDDESLKDYILNTMRTEAAESGREFSDLLAENMVKGKQEKDISGLKENTDHYAYAFRVDKDGTAEGKVFKTGFNTSVNSISFSFTMENLTPSTVTITTEPSDSETFYYTDVIEKDMLKEIYGEDDNGIILYVKDVMSSTASKYDITMEELIGELKISGTDVYEYNDLVPSTEYYVYAVQISPDNKITDFCAMELFSTKEVEMLDMTFDIDIENIQPDQADVTVTPSMDKELYLMDIVYTAELTKFESDEEIVKAVISKFGPSLETSLSFGKKTVTFYELDPDTDWTVLVFGYDSGTNNTALFRKSFRTEKSEDAAELTFKIDVVAEQIKAKATFRPSIPSIRYAYEIMPKDKYVEYGGNKDALQKYYKEMIDRIQQQQPSLGVSDIVYQITAKRDYTYNMSFLTPDREYIAWAASCTDEGVLISEPTVKEFRTKEYIMSTATAELVLELCFDGGEVYEVDPYLGTNAEMAVGFFRVNVSDNAAETWSAIYEGDFTSQETYPDYKLVAKMENDGNKNVYKPVYRLEWDTPMTICTFAKDNSGNYGPIQRELINIGHDDVDPISEYPYYWQAPPVEMNPDRTVPELRHRDSSGMENDRTSSAVRASEYRLNRTHTVSMTPALHRKDR